ncbi:MAG TPA: tRNA pseudouridine(13) synthase TruD [Chromatiales bacterium]|jgi:tRNA pseudouridine13 synthase|nr:tRNA pseudouridine(13) synthase TruD [Chromatiaceae bacterium]HIB84675.1 tRNA pseudouridine(13) synthase TruD [Chromatiaceae bacterium]HIN82327.1 tRNA pseudouridine(13) synthase TruD [Chromatiales bacterium]HIO54276.1 tRNA pseudouridine(13) synthase TruD [Chromatiales bacterium]
MGDVYSRLEQLPRAWGPALGEVTLKKSPHDFHVDEILGFEPDRDGEHRLLLVRKSGWNTEDVVRLLSTRYGVSIRDIGYSGLKDRQAVTTQWFSLQLPAREPEPDNIDTGVEVLAVHLHRRKLRRGAHQGNRFTLALRDCDVDDAELAQRIECIRQGGVPNYFGDQRFGRNHSNLGRAIALFEGNRRGRSRGLMLSAARAWLFNQVVARRVADASWNRALTGDAFVLDGSRSFFSDNENRADIAQRLRRGDIHPSGPMWGRGDAIVSAQTAELESEALQPWQTFCRGLEEAGLKQERRPLRVIPRELAYETKGSSTLTLSFVLPRGAYATALLHSIFSVAVTAPAQSEPASTDS